MAQAPAAPWPLPGAQPLAQHGAAPPHLAAYPPPIGGAAPGQLLHAVAAAQQVSPHAAQPHNGVIDARAVVIGNDSSVYNNIVRHLGQPPAMEATGKFDPGLAGTNFYDVPALGSEERPSLAAKAPKSAAEVDAWIWDWFNHSAAAADQAQCRPVGEFVRQTVKFATEVSDPSKVMDYFRMTMTAVKAGMYDVLRHGPVYSPAETRHITPFRKPAGWPARDFTKKRVAKRAAPSAPANSSSGKSGGGTGSSSGSAGSRSLKWCDVHGECYHTTLKCRDGPAAKKPRHVVPAADAARARRAAAGEDD